MDLKRFKESQFLVALVIVASGLLIAPHGSAFARESHGAVYVTTNDPSGNSVLVYHRDAKGALTFAAEIPTGGKGIGGGLDPLGSQGSISLSRSGRLLFAVNAGSN